MLAIPREVLFASFLFSSKGYLRPNDRVADEQPRRNRECNHKHLHKLVFTRGDLSGCHGRQSAETDASADQQHDGGQQDDGCRTSCLSSPELSKDDGKRDSKRKTRNFFGFILYSCLWLIHQLDITRSPGLVEPRLQRAVDA